MANDFSGKSATVIERFRQVHEAQQASLICSYEKTSVYTLAGWTPIVIGPLHIGIAVGALNGSPGLNNGGITKAAAAVFRMECERIGVNLLVIPPALITSPVTIGLQVKFMLSKIELTS